MTAAAVASLGETRAAAIKLLAEMETAVIEPVMEVAAVEPLVEVKAATVAPLAER